MEQAIWEQTGFEFNVGSPKQLADVLFERLGLPKGRKTKTGYSTGSAVLKRLTDAHPVVPLTLRHRELSKLCGTYVRPMLEAVNDVTGRIHTRFNQTGAATGRLSSSGPNLQSIPIRTDLGRRIRRGFVAAPGNVLISADYSQVELRVLAHVSQDRVLQKAFIRGDDIHVQTAATIFDTDPSDVSDEQRRMAKVVNYGLIYGMGDFGLSSRMGISLDRARAFLDDYMVNFAGVAGWRDRIVKEAEESGCVRSMRSRGRESRPVTMGTPVITITVTTITVTTLTGAWPRSRPCWRRPRSIQLFAGGRWRSSVAWRRPKEPHTGWRRGRFTSTR